MHRARARHAIHRRIPISHTRELIDDGYSLNEIGTKLVDNYAAQILDAGFFPRRPPTPGNIEIRGGKIILLDLGMTGRLDARTRVALKQMLFAVAKQNSADLADALLRFAGTDVERADYPVAARRSRRHCGGVRHRGPRPTSIWRRSSPRSRRWRAGTA